MLMHLVKVMNYLSSRYGKAFDVWALQLANVRLKLQIILLRADNLRLKAFILFLEVRNELLGLNKF